MKGAQLDPALARPLVIAIHGAAVNAASWLPLQRLFGEEIEFVAPDLPGHGTNRDMGFSIAASLKLIEVELSKSVDRRPVVLVGDSLGGYIALLAAAQAGDRVHAVVAGGASFKMTGMGGTLLKVTDAPIELLQFFLGRQTSERLFRTLIRRMTDADTAEAIFARGLRIEGRHESILALQDVDILAAVKACKGRVYIVNGGLDFPAVWYTRTFAGAAKDGYAVVIPGALHGCAVRRPAEFADILRTAISSAQSEIARGNVEKTRAT